MYLVLFLDHAVITVGKPNFSYKKGGGVKQTGNLRIA